MKAFASFPVMTSKTNSTEQVINLNKIRRIYPHTEMDSMTIIEFDDSFKLIIQGNFESIKEQINSYQNPSK